MHQDEKAKIKQFAKQYIAEHGGWMGVTDPDKLANLMSDVALAMVDSGYAAYLVKADPDVLEFANSSGLGDFMLSQTQGATLLVGSSNHSYFTATQGERGNSQIHLASYRDGGDLLDWTPGKLGDIAINAATAWVKHSSEFPELPPLNDYVAATKEFRSLPGYADVYAIER